MQIGPGGMCWRGLGLDIQRVKPRALAHLLVTLAHPLLRHTTMITRCGLRGVRQGLAHIAQEHGSAPESNPLLKLRADSPGLRPRPDDLRFDWHCFGLSRQGAVRSWKGRQEHVGFQAWVR